MVRILFIRHGQSQGNVDEAQYTIIGDHKIGITDTGWRQAVAAGRFLQGYMMGSGIKNWPLMFVSSYRRTKETLSGVVHGMKGYLTPLEGPDVREEPRLIEKFFGATLRLSKGIGPVEWKTASQFWQMAHDIFRKDKFTTRNMLGDSRKDTFEAVCAFIEGPMAKAIADGEAEIVIVSHGAVGQEFIRKMMNLPMDADIPDLGNCDILEFEGEPGNWTMRKLYDGPAMRPSGDLFVGHIKPLTLSDLPPVPEAFR
jgi:broad specificity phosphatase PhoE